MEAVSAIILCLQILFSIPNNTSWNVCSEIAEPVVCICVQEIEYCMTEDNLHSECPNTDNTAATATATLERREPPASATGGAGGGGETIVTFVGEDMTQVKKRLFLTPAEHRAKI
jgi:hypothetical protein